MGARNAALWYTHNAVQPAPLNFAITDASCLKCHQDVTAETYTPKKSITLAVEGEGRRGQGLGGDAGPNHWHQYLAQWQAGAPDAATCVTCHSGHSTDGTEQSGFQNAPTTGPVCEGCHKVLREEG